MSKLGIKIFLIMLSVAIMGLVFIGLYLNYSIPEHFKDYLYLEKKRKNRKSCFGAGKQLQRDPEP